MIFVFTHIFIVNQSGIVIASPSTVNPDYVFTWVRDSSLVFKVIIDQYANSCSEILRLNNVLRFRYTTGQDKTLLGLIQNFITAESNLQEVSNPSGTISTGGLGEPKVRPEDIPAKMTLTLVLVQRRRHGLYRILGEVKSSLSW
jgi:hypothetical protein